MHSQYLRLTFIQILLCTSACALDDVEETSDAVRDGILVDDTLIHVRAAAVVDESPILEPADEPINDEVNAEASAGNDPDDYADDAEIADANRRNTPHLTYHGGLLIPEVRVHPVFWNRDTRHQNNLNMMYKAITQSKLFDMLRQYSARKQLILRGTAATGYVNNGKGRRITDRDIRQELNRLFSHGLLLPPTKNSYYPIHFPPGVTIEGPPGSGVGTLCVNSCGYHYAYKHNNANVYYGVIPDLGGPCARGCGAGSEVDNLDSTSSHELVEAVTDPASSLGRAGWFDNRTGFEIADICNQRQAKIQGGDGKMYSIQREWSNRANKCVTH